MIHDGVKSMFEVEQKYWVDDLDALQSKLRALGAVEGETQQHADEYFNHPSRDFAQTHEALRIRHVDDVAYVTYKGTKLPGAVKARVEMEWSLSPGDPEGAQTAALWTILGFRRVAIVRKSRRTFRCEPLGSDLSITIDSVADVGLFSEVELVVSHQDEVALARERILGIGVQLGFKRMEPRSYLSLLLAGKSTANT